jgi:hypothetical protein
MLTVLEKQTIKRAAKKPGSSHRIDIVSGDKAPVLLGDPFYFSNSVGARVYSLSDCYGPGTWTYHKSTQRIELGREWVMRMRKAYLLKLDPVTVPDGVLHDALEEAGIS